MTRRLAGATGLVLIVLATLSTLATPAIAALAPSLDTYFDGPPGPGGKPAWTTVPRDEWTQVPPVEETTKDKWGRTDSAFACFDFGPYPNITQAAYGVTNIIICGNVNIALPPPSGESPPAGQTWVCFDGPDAIKYTVPFTEPRCNWGTAGGSFEVDLTAAQLAQGLAVSKQSDKEQSELRSKGATIGDKEAPAEESDRQSPEGGLPDWLKKLIGAGGVAALTGAGFQVTRKRKISKEKGEGALFEEQLDVTREVEGAALDDHVKGKAGYGVYTERKSNLSLDDGLRAELGGKVQVGGKLEAEEHLTSEKAMGDVYSKQELFGGVEGETKNEAKFTREGVELGSASKAFAGVRAKGELTGRLSGFEVTDEAQVQAGAGAGYAVGVNATPHKISGTIGANASLGVGGGNTVKFSVDLDRVGKDLTTTFPQFSSPPAPRGSYQLVKTGGGW